LHVTPNRIEWQFNGRLLEADVKLKNAVGPEGTEQDNSSTLLDLLGEAGDLVSGLPPQVRQSFFKAAGRVLAGLAEVPAAYFDGHAAVIRAKADAKVSEIRAKQRAREVVLIDSARAAARQFGDPELATRALQYHAADIIREQNSREAVLRVAAEELRTSPPEQDAANEIDDDWLLAFLKEASNKTNDDMRILFGRILTGGIKNPGSFSLRTVLTLGLLTPSQHVADLFCRFCSLTIDLRTIGSPVTVCNLGRKNTYLAEFGLPYLGLFKLIEHDLVRSDIHTIIKAKSVVYEKRIPFHYADMKVWWAASPDTSIDSLPKEIKIAGPTLTQVGEELKAIVSIQPVPEYTDALRDWLRSQHMTMYKCIRKEGQKLHGVPL
jgi:hypothetical protein